jgi:hypothetical protein
MVQNLLDEGARWLSNQLDLYASSEVEYRRDSTIISLWAAKGRTQFELTDTNGMIIAVESRDFLISADNLVLNGRVILPKVGDRIVESVHDKLHGYEVSNFGGDQPYRFCDPYRHKVRIHTRFIGILPS